MKKGKITKLLGLVLSGVMVLSVLTACGTTKTDSSGDSSVAAAGNSTKATESAKKITIGYASKSSTAPFWVFVDEGAKKAAEELGVELIALGPPKENDITGQISVVEDMLNRNINALVLAPCDSAGIVPVIQKANAAKVPVVCVDNGADGGDIISLVATDNIKAAEQAAKWMGDKLGGKGNIVLINGMIAQGTGKERREGFKNYIEKNYPDIKIVAEVAGDWDDQKALKGMEDVVQANKQIDGIFVGWDGAALSAHQVLKEAKMDKTLICGFDCYPQSLKFMKEGTFAADVAQYPFKIGYEGVKAAVAAVKGETVEKRIDTGTILVLPENVDQYIKDNKVELPK